MATKKKWEEFEENDTQFKKSESVQQDIQQILDTVTQIKTDVDQLKADGPQATGPADSEPSLSAPVEDNQPPMDMGEPPADAPASGPEESNDPQEPIGDLMAQPEDGAATPVPEESAPAEELPAEPEVPEEPAPQMGGYDYTQDLDEIPDEDIILDTIKDIKDPELKKQLLALAYQHLEMKTQPPMPGMMPPVGEEIPAEPAAEQLPPGAEEALAELMEGVDPMMKSETAPVACDADVAGDISKDAKATAPIAASDDEEKKDDEEKEEKKDDEKEEKKEDSEEKKDDEKDFEPGVTGLPEGKDEDNDSAEDLPVVTEVSITEDESPEGEKEEAIESIVDSILEEAKEKISEQVVEAVNGIDDMDAFMLSTSTSDLMKAKFGKKLDRGFRKSIQWPEDVKSIPMEDKCKLFAKSFSQMDRETQDAVVGLMDRSLGEEKTNSIFKSEGVDLEKIYKSVPVPGDKPNNTVAGENGASQSTEPVADSNDDVPETDPMANCNDTTPVKDCNDTTSTKKSATPEMGIHIPTVSEMLEFKKSGKSAYTPVPREMAEPHMLVSMGEEQSIPSTRELMARFAKQ